MQKTVYQTDSNGLYLYESVANELSLSPGSFNIPFGAYLDAPPQAEDGRRPRRDGDKWELVEDHRETSLWFAETGDQYTLGNVHDVDGVDVSYPGWGPIPAWLTAVAPVQSAQGAAEAA
ncbi:phage tail protein [Achromobacter seleniivolatilans]|uniref:Phage tail protein n=1 Tax=Achromobacter seleniivolatilans TaxID=3047478 RepID=A0ABY9M1T3_9BURK|nr:phage tail protein [Achromobacter sp. R39]WMD20915.1 phage tail protein [Achromobacter sp. R39]